MDECSAKPHTWPWLCCSEQRGQQPRPERGGAGAREEDPGVHPPARPQAPHRGRPQLHELHTGQSEPCGVISYPNQCTPMSKLVSSSCYVGHFSVCSCPWADPPLSGFVSGPPSAESHFAENIFKVNLTRKYISVWFIFLDVNIFFFVFFMQEMYHHLIEALSIRCFVLGTIKSH